MKLNDSYLLLNDAKDLLHGIEQLYQESLHQKQVPQILLVRIKHFLDNVRSALDYSAFHIFSSFCADNIDPNKLERAEKRVYFPTINDEAEFEKNIEGAFPGLPVSKPSIVASLKAIQPFNGASWLKHLNELSNKNKHRYLTPQTRTEQKRVNVSGPNGGLVSWDPSSVRFGSGVFIHGVPVNPHTQLPVPNQVVTTEVVTWISFRFTEINEPVLSTLQNIYNEADQIINKIENSL